MKLLWFVLLLSIISISCATQYGSYEKREHRWLVLPEYKKVPESYVSGNEGYIKKTIKPDGTVIIEAGRTKGGALIDMGNILSVAKPTTEIK